MEYSKAKTAKNRRREYLVTIKKERIRTCYDIGLYGEIKKVYLRRVSPKSLLALMFIT